jgi:uncharacterized protein
MFKYFALGLFVMIMTASAYQQNSVMIEMNDGIKLSTIIYTPDDMSGAPYPVILARTPYNAEENAQQLSQFLRIITDIEGYIVVVQNTRGRNGSEGKNTTFLEDGWGEKKDGLETIDWIAAQDWCNGDIGMFGPSALAISQYLAAGAVPENLKCGFPIVGAWSLYHNMIYQGGEFRQLDGGLWVTLFSSSDMLDTIKAHYNYSEMWDLVNCHTRVDKMKVPMFHIGGWYDLFAPGQLEAFYDMQYHGGEGARNQQKVMIGPWTHNTIGSSSSGDISFPANAAVKIEDLAISWYDYALKGQEGGWAATIPPINLYLMGPVDQSGYWNDWLRFYDWPFTNTDTLRFYPSRDGDLLLEIPAEGQSTYTFNPLLPVQTVGGNIMFDFNTGSGPVNQNNTVWERNDVLTFISPSFDDPYDIFGNVKLNLVVSSEAKDTDFTGKLVDIYPDGRRILISDGIIMARHRNSFRAEDLLVPDEVYEIELDLNYTCYTIAPGHKLGLAISSSNFPKYQVNPNTGNPVHSDGILNMKIVDNTVFFGSANPTSLVLPIRKTITSVTDMPKAKMKTGTSIVRNSTLSLQTSMNTGTVDVRLYTLQGNTVLNTKYNSTMGQIEIPFKHPSGVYFLEIRQYDRIEIYKILNGGI